jgi:hypothetical protein
MLFKNGSIIYGVLLIRISIKITTDIFQTIEDMPCFPSLGAFESSMFAEMSESFFPGIFQSGTGIYLVTAVNNG